MTPILSLVSGTFNRLASLQRMIDSARYAIPRGLSYEIVLVDGGSTDGTLEWAAAQPNVRVIAHGELRGAIRAFCDGARAATGEYVLLANDDVTFEPLSIVAALSHLERTPSCGAVAFADNRTSLVRGDGTQYRVEAMGATAPDGRPTMVAYAQVGMFRRWLGNACGWWGDTDPVMSQARTYGGDNHLSSCIWEAGYTVDAVPQAVVADHIERDGLRDKNAAQGPLDSACYYRRFPTVHLPAQLATVEANNRLRILSLPVYEWTFPGKRNVEAGLTEALADYGLAFEWDYLNEPIDLIALVRAWQPDLLLTQIQGVGRITPYMLASMRNAAPGMTAVNWNGDAHEAGLTSPGVLGLLRYVDLQTVINAKVLPDYGAFGVRAAYWQIGFKDPIGTPPDQPSYEVLLQMNCYNDVRTAMVAALRAMRLPDQRHPRLGVYGNCTTADGNTHYDFARQRSLYANATITVGDTYPGTYGFVSNRLFQALSAGAFLLQQHSEGLEQFTGLVAGVHYVEWVDLPDLKHKIVQWLDKSRGAERKQIADAGRDYVRANFSYAAQCRKLFEDLLPMIAEGEHATV
jgi:glycosyltransferase involved in cell wall biosynthesis